MKWWYRKIDWINGLEIDWIEIILCKELAGLFLSHLDLFLGKITPVENLRSYELES